jgi:predicted NBD/HSP70 family sugar kinase
VRRLVSDSDSVRRQNRSLVLAALRAHGAQSRSSLASQTGLSNASITAITQDMLAQNLLAEQRDDDRAETRNRGRPAVHVGFERTAGSAALIELEVNRARFSVVDYGGTLIDRLEFALAADAFKSNDPADYLNQGLVQLAGRNRREFANLCRIAVSLQGMLARDGGSLKWSPIAGLADVQLVEAVSRAFNVPVRLHKRGRLLAEGSRWLDPSLRTASVATVFVGSTIAMGLTLHGDSIGRGEHGATEFGHMNHIPDGALCRCGARGCVEAYAADYAILRTAYSVPETAVPAASVPLGQYEGLIHSAEAGDRNARHAFNTAGRAIGYALSRVMALVDPSHILFIGPGARAFHLMRQEIEAALKTSLVYRINGAPQMLVQHDEQEPVYRGLLMKTLADLDREFADLPAVAQSA